MAKKLIDGMTTDWEPDKYKDEYKTQLMAMIEEKVKHPNEKHEAAKAPKKATNVIDLMSVLEESLAGTKGGKAKASAPEIKGKGSQAQTQEGRVRSNSHGRSSSEIHRTNEGCDGGGPSLQWALALRS